MPSLLIGLLCRFLGARFVVSTKTGFVAAIGRSAHSHQVKITVKYTGTRVAADIAITNMGGSQSVRSTSMPVPHETKDAPLTSAVAAWIIPHIAAVTGPALSDPGIASVSRITRLELLDTIAAFAGSPLRVDSQGKTWTGKKNIVLWPRHIVIKTKKGDRVTPFPPAVEMAYTDNGDFAYTSVAARSPAHAVDAMIVDACRAAVLA